MSRNIVLTPYLKATRSPLLNSLYFHSFVIYRLAASDYLMRHYSASDLGQLKLISLIGIVKPINHRERGAPLVLYDKTIFCNNLLPFSMNKSL